jgi:phage terminase small subunit
MEKFTHRQKLFIDYYNGNATETAIKAGYSEMTAKAKGSFLLKNPKIKKAIQNRTERISKKHIGTREERQAFWWGVANDENVSMSDRLRASELLGKSMADFTDVQRHEGQINILPPIKINHTELKI